MLDLWLRRDVRIQVRMLHAKVIQQIAHEVIDDISLVAFSYRVEIDGRRRKPQRKPLQNHEHKVTLTELQPQIYNYRITNKKLRLQNYNRGFTITELRTQSCAYRITIADLQLQIYNREITMIILQSQNYNRKITITIT